jgi:hypothetical protein
MSVFGKLFGQEDVSRERHASHRSDRVHARGAAAKLLAFLEERHVLYKEMTEKCPRGVVRSARKIRSELRRRSAELESDSELARMMDRMRETALEFLDHACRGSSHPQTCDDCTISARGCAAELLELRRQMGQQIQALCSRFKLIPANCLKDILPTDGAAAPTCGISPTLLAPGDHEGKRNRE